MNKMIECEVCEICGDVFPKDERNCKICDKCKSKLKEVKQ